MPKKSTAIKHATILAAYLLVIWGFYRFLFKLPEDVEEFFIKPILWLLPVVYFLKKEKAGLETIGITHKNIFPAIYFALFLGVIFAIEGIAVNYIKYREFDFSANVGETFFFYSLLLSIATAISEEITFRGYLFTRIWHALGNVWTANAVTSIVWALIHIPISIFWWKLDSGETLSFVVLTTVFAIGSAFIFAKTRNIISSIILHVLWSWPIVLFR